MISPMLAAVILLLPMIIMALVGLKFAFYNTSIIAMLRFHLANFYPTILAMRTKVFEEAEEEEEIEDEPIPTKQTHYPAVGKSYEHALERTLAAKQWWEQKYELAVGSRDLHEEILAERKDLVKRQREWDKNYDTIQYQLGGHPLTNEEKQKYYRWSDKDELNREQSVLDQKAKEWAELTDRPWREAFDEYKYLLRDYKELPEEKALVEVVQSPPSIGAQRRSRERMITR